MNHDTSWFARLRVDQGLFTGSQRAQIRRKLGVEAELMAFAQELIDRGTVADVDLLERLAAIALEKAQVGPPSADPVVESMEEPPPAGEGSAPRLWTDAADEHSFAFKAVQQVDNARRESPDGHGQ